MDATLATQPADIFESLTAAQLAAVRTSMARCLILAGPGSGKTRVVTHRIAHLLQQGIAGRQIRRADLHQQGGRRDEGPPGAARRRCRRSGWARSTASVPGCCGSTARSSAWRENYSIYDIDDSRKMLAEAIVDEGIDLTHATPDAVAHAISWAKNNLMTPGRVRAAAAAITLGGIVERVYPAYQQRLLQANAVDFDDLLLHVATLLKENPEVRGPARRALPLHPGR